MHSLNRDSVALTLELIESFWALLAFGAKNCDDYGNNQVTELIWSHSDFHLLEQLTESPNKNIKIAANSLQIDFFASKQIF